MGVYPDKLNRRISEYIQEAKVKKVSRKRKVADNIITNDDNSGGKVKQSEVAGAATRSKE